jgi:hypothetical protein
MDCPRLRREGADSSDAAAGRFDRRLRALRGGQARQLDGAIQRALAYKVASLDADGNFNPKSELSRADAAAEVYHALQYIEAHPAPAD